MQTTKTTINRILINVMCVMLVFGCFLKAKADQPRDMVRYYLQTNQTPKAKSLLLKELSSKIITSDRTYLLGKLYVVENKTDSAQIIFNTLNPAVEDQRLLSLIGKSLIDISKGSKSDVALRMLKELKSLKSTKSPMVKIEAAYVLALVNEKDKAWDFIEQACTLQPVSAETFVAAGDVYIRLSSLLKDNSLYGKACGRFEQALLVDKNYLPALTALGKAYTDSRNFGEARQKLQQAIEVDSTWIPALQLMGELQYDLGNYKKASYYYSKYIASIKPDKEQLQKYAYILYFDQDHAKANEIISTLLKDDPNNRVLLRLMAYTSCELKDTTRGMQAMQKFMNLKTTNDSVRFLSSDFEYYGRLLSLESKDSLAVQQYLKAIQYDTTVMSNYEYLAKSYEKLKDFEGAMVAYNKLTLDPKATSTTWFSKGRNLLLLAEEIKSAGDSVKYVNVLNDAVLSFRKVTEMSPNSHLGYLWEGRALAALDPESTKGLAEDSYKKAIEILEAKNQTDKYKSELIESYSYMGYLYYLKNEATRKTGVTDADNNKSVSLEYWNKILTLDPTNQAAIQATKALK
jgi:tetratricopeptide (TPR) repeat protein